MALLLLSLLVALQATSDAAESSLESAAQVEEQTTNSTRAVLSEMQEWMNLSHDNTSNMSFQLHEVEAVLNDILLPARGAPDRGRSGFSLPCAACHKLAKNFIAYIRLGGKMALVSKLMKLVCTAVVYNNKAVCSGFVNRNEDHLHYVVKEGSFSAKQMCSMIMSGRQVLEDCGLFKGPSWAVFLPPPSRTRRAVALASTNSTGASMARQVPLLASFYSNQTDDGDASHSATSSVLQSTVGSTESLVGLEVTTQESGSQHRSTNYTSSNRTRVKRGVPPYASFNNGRPYLKVLHLTDIHYDPSYEAGNSAVCEAFVCCRTDSGKPKRANETAGRWGDYRKCDTPGLLLKNLLQHLRREHSNIDYIMWTGDNVPHAVWETTAAGNIAVLSEVTAMLHQYFPGIPVYGTVGNHESSPTDVYPPPEVPQVWRRFSNQWLYDTLVEQWQSFVPDTPIAASARVAGCYAMLVRDGFKIISINTIFCDKYNWWVLFKSTDPGNILSWLVGELVAAEENGEYVHIIGHIAPLHVDCYEEWGHQFSRIVTRFSHIIRGQFYGHDHRDGLRIHFDVEEPNLPIGVQYLTPNNGPYTGYNPSFRIFYVDGDHKGSTRGIIDYETHFMNLTSANLNGDTRWQLLYWAKQGLGLDSLEPVEYVKFVERLKQDPELAKRWFRYQVQASDLELARGCDAACRQSQICSILDGDKFLPSKC